MKDIEHSELAPGNAIEVDEAMLEMRDLISQMSEVDGYLLENEEGFVMRAENVTLDMPLQLDLRVLDNGEVKIGSSPPLYYVETTVMPVFHQLRINIEVDKRM